MKTSFRFKHFIRLSFLSVLIVHSISAQVSDTIQVEPGWNLLSLPIKMLECEKCLFPSARTNAFIYQNSYVAKDTLENGYGFWIKFDSAETFILNGEAIHRDTVNVTEGWNMIGSISEILHVDMISTEPPGIIISDLFNYSPSSGYEASEFIIPGVGYWVKVNQSGSIILSAGPPCPGIPTVTYAGRVYNTVQIGSQCWLKENLNVGTMIQGADTAKDNGIIEKYCYNNDTSKCNTYGGLYQWNETMQYSPTPGARGICPTGWHIPTQEEYQILSDAVGGDAYALKVIGEGTGDGAGTNMSGFSALLAGGRYDDGAFYYLSDRTYFWSSTEYDYTYAGSMTLYSSTGYVYLYTYYRVNGLSVRCIKDSIITQNIPCPGTPTVEYEGKTYNTVQIGSQCWLKENIDVGTMIQGVDTSKDNGIIEKYCYNNDTTNCNTYGGLYQWNEAMQYTTTPGARGICPTGWHIPTLAEFETLENTVGVDGNTLKAIGQGTGYGAGTNTSGFSALIAGYRSYDGYFYGLSSYAYFWSSTEYYSSNAYGMYLYYNNGTIYLYDNDNEGGFSVRCLKGEGANTPPIVPYNPHPDDSSVDTDTSITLSWSCKDPDGDSLTYDIFFGTDNPPSTMVTSNQADISLNRNALTANTTYYWQIVAKDVHGAYRISPVWRLTTKYNDGGIHCSNLPFVEYEGKKYNTVQIGSQCWLRENLNVGTMIDSLQNSTNNGTIEKYCYHNDPENCNTYGGFYQWDEAMKYSTVEGTEGICPSGWHIPKFSEFQTLKTAVGDDGNSLKAIGQGSGIGAGTNTSGFSALLAGFRTIEGYSNYLSENTYIWSSTEENSSIGKGMNLLNYTSGINLGMIGNKPNGFSIRCLKD